MFGIGGTELFLILIFGFLIFGPDKLPAMAKTIGQMLNKFKSAQEEMNKVIKTEVYDPNSDEPFKNPLDAIAKVAGSDKKEDKTESFSERKAKYDRERAAQKRAEAREEAKAKAESSDADAVDEKPASKSTSSSGAAAVSTTAASAAAKKAVSTSSSGTDAKEKKEVKEAKKKPDAEEL